MFDEMRKKQGSGDVHLAMPMATDNEGNAISVLNEKTKKWLSSIIMMQLVLDAHKHHVDLAINHMHREHNKWADQLARGDHSGFDKAKRLVVRPLASSWDLLCKLTASDIVQAQLKSQRKRIKSAAQRGRTN